MPKQPSPIHVFRAGRQTTAAGASLEFGESDMANTAKAYDPALHEAPICVGHPKHDLPAYGWVGGVSCSGPSLYAQPRQVNPEFAEMVRAGAFKKISAAFYAPDSPANPVPGVYYLRHVAFLGAQPPAVKGLQPVEFADVEAGVVEFAEIPLTEFSDPGLSYVGGVLRSLRDFFIEQFGLDKADKVLPSWQLESIQRMADAPDAETTTALNPSFTEPTPQETAVSTPDLKDLQAALVASEAKAATATKALADANAATAASARSARHADALVFAENLVTADKLLPRDKALVVSLLDAVEGDAPVEFGEGDDRKPTGKALRELLQGLPKHALNATHIALKGTAAAAHAADAQAIADQALEFQETQRAKGIVVSSTDAVAHITSQLQAA